MCSSGWVRSRDRPRPPYDSGVIEQESAATKLTARRGARYEPVRAAIEAHRAQHRCAIPDWSLLQSRELTVMVRATHSSYVLQIGGGNGYATLQVAATLGATGRVDVVEPDPVHVQLIEGNVERYGLRERVRIHGAAASEVIPPLSGPYDLVVGTAAWATYLPLFEDLLRLLRTGGSLYLLPRGAQGDDPGADELLGRLADDERLLTSFAPDLERVVAVRVR